MPRQDFPAADPLPRFVAAEQTSLEGGQHAGESRLSAVAWTANPPNVELGIHHLAPQRLEWTTLGLDSASAFWKEICGPEIQHREAAQHKSNSSALQRRMQPVICASAARSWAHTNSGPKAQPEELRSIRKEEIAAPRLRIVPLIVGCIELPHPECFRMLWNQELQVIGLRRQAAEVGAHKVEDPNG